MQKRIPNLAREATQSITAAQRQLATMQSQLRTLGDRVTGLQAAIKAPVPKGGRNTIKGSHSSLSPFASAELSSVGSMFAGSFLDSVGLGGGIGASRASFYVSQAQSGAGWLSDLLAGQRIS